MIITPDNRRLPTVTDSAILGFFGEYRFLSNYHPCSIKLEGITYPSTEHAYQAIKAEDQAVRLQISQLATPNLAKKFGKSIQCREGWDLLRIAYMHSVLVKKFEDVNLAVKLLQTGDKYLEETNNWGDMFWGVCVDEQAGQNMLGKLLMMIRADLRSQL
jgi:ribA/ribD-fused uncharacterized protein